MYVSIIANETNKQLSPATTNYNVRRKSVML